MTQLSINKTKCTGLLPIVGPVLLFCKFSFEYVNFGLEKLLRLSRSGLHGAPESTLFLS